LVIKIEVTNTNGYAPWVKVFFDNFELIQLEAAPFTFTIPFQDLTLGKHIIQAVAMLKEEQAVASVTFKVVESIDNEEKESPDFVSFTDGKLPDSWSTYTWEIANRGYDDNYSLKSANPIATVYTKKTIHAPAYVEFYTYIMDNPNGNIDLYIDDEKVEALLSEPLNNNWVKWIYAIDSGKHAFRWQTEGALKYLDAVTFAPAELPVVTTAYVHSITSSRAVSGGNVENHGNSNVFARGICWSTNENPTIDDNKTTNNYGLGNFTSYLTELTPNTTYYIRAYAINSVGITYGEERYFTTGH
jgi:hypothetical protein